MSNKRAVLYNYHKGRSKNNWSVMLVEEEGFTSYTTTFYMHDGTLYCTSQDKEYYTVLNTKGV